MLREQQETCYNKTKAACEIKIYILWNRKILLRIRYTYNGIETAAMKTEHVLCIYSYTIKTCKLQFWLLMLLDELTFVFKLWWKRYSKRDTSYALTWRTLIASLSKISIFIPASYDLFIDNTSIDVAMDIPG